MKKTLLVGLAISVVSLAATAVFAGPSPVKPVPTQGFAGAKNVGGTGIVGSSHDLSSAGGTSASDLAKGYTQTGGVGGDAQSRICVFCHHPHNSAATGTVSTAGAAAITYSPLWNRDLSTKTFAAYNNGGFENSSSTPHALNAVYDSATGLAGVSLLCMSCHDGVVAMNAYSQNTGTSDGQGDTATGGAITSSAGFSNRGGASDMSNHHPMGFNYADVAAIDNEIAQPTVAMVPTGFAAGVTVAPGTGGTLIGDLLDGTGGSTGRMECVTCHDVHNTQNAAGAERFLWRSNNSSNFCLTCHLK
jgi:hypothetical protein